MYNKIICAILIFFNVTQAIAQEKYGKEWFLGNTGQVLNFDTNPPKSRLSFNLKEDTVLIVDGNSNICDSNGHLLFATDGITLYDSFGKFIEGGGENINNDSLTYDYGFESAYPNTSIILPKGNNQYYIFITTMSDSKWTKYVYNWNNDTFDFDEVRYSIVDINGNNFKGKIIEKNKLLLHTDEYPWVNKSNFTACRHANGRDWWLLKPSARMRQVMYKFLVTPDAIITYKENLPTLFNTWAYDNVGQSCFSQDGNLYAECNQYGPHTIYNFDRCSGNLELKRLINLTPYQDTFGNNLPTWAGLCFSPNGRFLYTCNFFNVYQIDLWESSDSLSIKRVSKDTILNISPFGFPQYACMQLTPTGVIYLGNWHGISPRVNGILYPDKLGDSCGFVFNYFISKLSDTLEISNTMDPPNMPFYGLGALKGSPCDTLNPSTQINTVIKIYPNPASDKLTIELPTDSKKAEVVVYNILGEVVLKQTKEAIVNDKVDISVRHLARSMYSVEVIADGERFVGKFLKE